MLIYYTIPIVRRHGQDKSENGLCLLSPPHWRVLENGGPHYKYQKINIRHYFTIYIIFNDKIAPDQCWYIIPYRLYDVTGRINPRMDYAFCLLHIEEFWKMAGATGNFNHQILPYGILFLTCISTNVFYLPSFKFSRYLVKTMAFSFKVDRVFKFSRLPRQMLRIAT